LANFAYQRGFFNIIPDGSVEFRGTDIFGSTYSFDMGQLADCGTSTSLVGTRTIACRDGEFGATIALNIVEIQPCADC